MSEIDYMNTMNNRYCCENRISHPTNCKNCGAPLHGSRCEFCGTEYPVNVAYDNKVTINVQGLAFPTVGELCKAISEQMQNCCCVSNEEAKQLLRRREL